MQQDLNILWNDVCRGDRDAWRQIVHRFEALVYTVALRTGLSTIDSHDCAQQTWLSLYKNRFSIRDPVKLHSWLSRTTRRKALRMLQRKSREVNLSQSYDAPDTQILPDDELILIEQRAQFEIALRQIDSKCQSLLKILFFSDDKKSYDDIAKELKIPLNSFGPTRSRCLKKLKEALRKLGYL